MEHIIFPIILFILTMINAFRSPDTIKKTKDLIFTSEFLINVFFIFLFISWIGFIKKYKNKHEVKEKAKESIKKATIAFIIGIFSELNLIYQPFWLIFLLSFYMEGWI